jgi:hypothetical protein
MTIGNLTTTPSVSSTNLQIYGEPIPSRRTNEVATEPTPNYKQTSTVRSYTEVESGARAGTEIIDPKSATPQQLSGQAEERTFKGVVDQVAPSSCHVTLFYGDRENKFLFPTSLLEASGASYPGALFNIVLKKENGFQTYDIVHLIDEETKARQEAPPVDLSFLNGIENKRDMRRK